MENIINFIPENMLIVVIGLWIIGYCLKKTPKVEDWCIPWVLILIGMIFSIGLNIIDNDITSNLLVTATLQGICCAGVAVLGNQLKKQTEKEMESEKRNIK
ncbi:phage holin family protein [Clostridium baratii]|uniref:phage holin family protein n=1 Tax=Clostridium baratii TaxID=1561 RepID=UPI0030CA8804